MNDEIRREVRELLRAKGMTQEEVAARLGIAAPNVSRMLREGGSGATPKNWDALLEMLGLELTVKSKEPKQD